MTYYLSKLDSTNSFIGDVEVTKEVFYGFLSSYENTFFEFKFEFNRIYIFKDNLLIAFIRDVL